MKRAAFGVRMHSGWGVLVAISGDADSVEIIDRRRIVTTDTSAPGANQPYHYAANLELKEAETYIANSAGVSQRLALKAVTDVVRELEERHYRIVGSAVLLTSGRPLPSLSKILAAHPLIHTAEGEFFRDAVRKACERLEISVTGVRERDLDEQAKAAFGNAANRIQRTVSSLGNSIGPPWTKDHKATALAASIILSRERTLFFPGRSEADLRGRKRKVKHAIRHL
ncbi:MAG TPA: hypothetical protein VNZ03_36030 [Terriglobales bacterium]|jgi:hypothetical protein|nr:hypothetical protein [Terriglobales bacterium]